ncbi:MAG: hypothetical protein E6K59_09780 [Nitrospirae bacterium]|nr:MAG: hypothetical protein E6K59_09780 [Nitrospirota bacterium]
MSLDLRTGEPLKAGASYADRPFVALPEGELCDICGFPMLDVHCKLICRNCGFMRDCSDP